MLKGLNNEKVQQSNRTFVLSMIIENGIVTRKELVEETGLGKPTITNIINELLESGLIEECEAPRKTDRRKSEGLRLKSKRVKVISARWVRTYFEIALYTLSGDLVDIQKCNVNGEEEITETKNRILSTCDMLLERHNINHILGMCVGVPGPYIRGGKNLALVPGYEQIRDVDIQKLFEERYDFPVVTEQDAHLSAFAEWKNLKGTERISCSCLLALQSIGIGIGAGIILDGKIAEGAFGIAGEIGQIGIEYTGPQNRLGTRGTLEYYASSDSVRRYVKDRIFEFPESCLSENSSYQEIVRAYQNKDPLAEWAFDTLAWKLAYGLIDTIFVINPNMIVIGPDYPKEDRFIAKIINSINQMTEQEIGKMIEVRYSTIKEDPTLKGGYYYVLDSLIHSRILYERVKNIMNTVE